MKKLILTLSLFITTNVFSFESISYLLVAKGTINGEKTSVFSSIFIAQREPLCSKYLDYIITHELDFEPEFPKENPANCIIEKYTNISRSIHARRMLIIQLRTSGYDEMFIEYRPNDHRN
ncbi:hypothetical protein A9Q84_15540 [Halobacteriovorax marinus]|uniref:Uncharacterized protein n=1 Tax=Halobacteriovorax marinus TaxID=97084 RepID=A0A1Y5F460_9BACT|nr:hypothetical protein A9Q84_15540 [Halobacteriovorax marinus]